MSLQLPKFIVKKISGGVEKISDPDDSSIDLRVNNPWEATIKFNNSNGYVDGIFSCEDEVALFIGTTASSTNLVMVGFIDEIFDEKNSNNERIQKIHIVDWVSYYAAKTIYEREWLRSTTQAATIISGSGGTVAEISTLGSDITGLTTTTAKIPRKFNGTYVKDAWHMIAENAGADFTPSYSVDAGLIVYTKKINFFDHGERDLTNNATGLIYKIKDIVPTTSDTLMIIHNSPYEFVQSAKNRFTSVVAMTGQVETFPDDINQWCSTKSLHARHPTTGKDLSSQFTPFKVGTTDVHWKNSASPTIDPFSYVGDDILCGAGTTGAFNAPTIKLNIRDTTSKAETFVVGRDNVTTTSPTFSNMGLVVTDWQKIAFMVKNGLTGATVNSIKLRLYDHPIANDYWERDIYNDVIVSGGSRTSWTYLEYALPATTIAATSNGWTKNPSGSPTMVDQVYLGFENGASSLTGYTASSYVGFSQFYFYRRQRASATGSGVLTTEKIMIDSSTKNPTALQTLATKELERVNIIGKTGFFTIAGNIAFTTPGYNINVDFSNTLGTSRSGSPVRISQIRHYLFNGRWFTYVQFEDSFQRG